MPLCQMPTLKRGHTRKMFCVVKTHTNYECLQSTLLKVNRHIKQWHSQEALVIWECARKMFAMSINLELIILGLANKWVNHKNQLMFVTQCTITQIKQKLSIVSEPR